MIFEGNCRGLKKNKEIAVYMMVVMGELTGFKTGIMKVEIDMKDECI